MVAELRTLRVLVVDDSTLNRRALTSLLEENAGVEVVGNASDGDEALRMVASLSPDLITLDLEMPRMDGFTFLRLLMASRPTPVIVVSSHSAKDNVFRALELGAIDFIAKPEQVLTGKIEDVRGQMANMVAMIRQLAPAGASRARRPPTAEAEVDKAMTPRPATAWPSPVVVIAASTGGPTALLELFSQLPGKSDAAIVVAQHMPDRFTKAFAERLNRISAFEVSEAVTREVLAPGKALVCPGGRVIELSRGPRGFIASVSEPASDDRYAPSADRLFQSAARAVGNQLVGVVLTGMGDDGAAGVVEIEKKGGYVLAESEESAVVYGMPRAAEQTGAVEAVLPLGDLIGRLATTLAE